VEKISRLLPTYLLGPETPAELVAGFWLTGGIEISASSFRRMRQAMGWLAPTDLKEVIEAAGFAVSEVVPSSRKREATRQLGETGAEAGKPAEDSGGKVFELPGRPVLAAFFNEHVVDIVNHRERYKALGIDFPSAVILHGPPGCGKTFAVERLIDFLGWPSFQVDAASVASPYIHETSKKVAEVFDKAMQNAPSVIVIDEMEAFLADREMGSGHHRVEEMAEFLRRIPEAVQYEVLVIGMTNRIEMIDPAILRRGRFDHVIEVSHASEAEILALVATLLTKLPTAHDVDGRTLARELNGRPLSDVAFVIREGARLAARGGNDRIEQKHLIAALKASPARSGDGDQERRIGFVWS
jgi:dephospho-CoA kinase